MNRNHTPLTRTSTGHTRGYNSKISVETIDEIIRRVDAGENRMDVARALRISRVTVYRYAPVGRFEKVDHTPHIRKLYHEGMTQIEIHEKLGVSKTMVYRAVLGLPRRKPGPKSTTPRTPLQPSNVSVASTKREEKKRTKATIQMEENHAQIKQLWLEELWTRSKIARHLSISKSTVDKALIAMGIENAQPIKKAKSIHPTAGKIPMTVPGTKGTYYVRPENLDRFRERHGLI